MFLSPSNPTFTRLCKICVKSPHIKLTIDDLPKILGACWDRAFTSSNIKAGFRKTGIHPLNDNWVEENKTLIHAFNGSCVARFEALLNRNKAAYKGTQDLLKACDYLDLAYDPSESKTATQEVGLDSILDSIFNRVSNYEHSAASSTTGKKKRVNKIGENVSHPKVLKFMQRIEALYQAGEKTTAITSAGANKSKSHYVEKEEEFRDDLSKPERDSMYKTCLSLVYYQ